MTARPLVVAALVLSSVVMGVSGGVLQRPFISGLFNRFQEVMNGNLGSGNPYRTLPKMPPVVSFSWNRTLGGINVKEEATYPNISQVPAMTVKSRDSRLKSIGFTAATTLYVFGQNNTTVIVKTESGSPAFPGPLQRFAPKPTDSACFVLPPRPNFSFAQASGQLMARDNKTISAPGTMERFIATGEALSMRTRMNMFMKQPVLFLFCTLNEMRTAKSLAGASSPVTATGKVLTMVTLDKKLQILVP